MARVSIPVSNRVRVRVELINYSLITASPVATHATTVEGYKKGVS